MGIGGPGYIKDIIFDIFPPRVYEYISSHGGILSFSLCLSPPLSKRGFEITTNYPSSHQVSSIVDRNGGACTVKMKRGGKVKSLGELLARFLIDPSLRESRLSWI